jgi:hypothetical protein
MRPASMTLNTQIKTAERIRTGEVAARFDACRESHQKYRDRDETANVVADVDLAEAGNDRQHGREKGRLAPRVEGLAL